MATKNSAIFNINYPNHKTRKIDHVVRNQSGSYILFLTASLFTNQTIPEYSFLVRGITTSHWKAGMRKGSFSSAVAAGKKSLQIFALPMVKRHSPDWLIFATFCMDYHGGLIQSLMRAQGYHAQSHQIDIEPR